MHISHQEYNCLNRNVWKTRVLLLCSISLPIPIFHIEGGPVAVLSASCNPPISLSLSGEMMKNILLSFSHFQHLPKIRSTMDVSKYEHRSVVGKHIKLYKVLDG